MTDKVLIRAKDVTLLISVLTLLGLVLSPVKKIFKFDDAVERIVGLEGRVNESEKNIAVINAQYMDIQKQLEQMNWQLRRIRDDRR